MSNFSSEINISGSSFKSSSNFNDGGVSTGLLVLSAVVISLWIMLGNTLVIATYQKCPPLQTVANTFIIHLAVVDEVTGLSCLVMVIPARFLPITFICTSFEFQLFTTLFATVPFVASFLFLLMVSVDRFIAVFWPLRYQTIMTQKRATVLSCVMWLLSMIYYIITMTDSYFQLKTTSEQKVVITCMKRSAVPRFMGMTFGTLYMVVLIPHIVIYICIFTVVIRQQKKMNITNENGSSNSGQNIPKSSLNLVKTALIVIGLFQICWTPFVVYLTTLQFDLIDARERTVGIGMFVAYVIAIINSGMNPIVYAVRSTAFRAGMRKVLKLKPNEVENVSHS